MGHWSFLPFCSYEWLLQLPLGAVCSRRVWLQDVTGVGGVSVLKRRLDPRLLVRLSIEPIGDTTINRPIKEAGPTQCLAKFDAPSSAKD